MLERIASFKAVTMHEDVSFKLCRDVPDHEGESFRGVMLAHPPKTKMNHKKRRGLAAIETPL